MVLRIVPVYAALFAVLFVLLSARVIRTRAAEQIGLGIGRHRLLERRVRVHANFAEYVPFTLLLLAMAEIRGAPEYALHLLCLGLVVGRVAHAWGVASEPEVPRSRVVGMACTLTALVGGALLIAAT